MGEAEEAASAADAAIIVVSGKNGVEVGTQKAWELCEKYKLPRMFYVSNMDVDNASFRQVVEDLTELYGKKIAPIHLPIRENEQFVGYVNVDEEERPPLSCPKVRRKSARFLPILKNIWRNTASFFLRQWLRPAKTLWTVISTEKSSPYPRSHGSDR